LVHIDVADERPHSSSLIALSAGRMIASSWGATLYAALIARDPRDSQAIESAPCLPNPAGVPGIAAIATELARAGADKVVVGLTDGPVAPLWAIVGGAWLEALDQLRPRLVLFGADSPSARELAPRTAARLGARLLVRARCVGVEDTELRDRDGGYARVNDGGAAVALIGRASASPPADDDVDFVVISRCGGADARLELAGASTVDLAHAANVIVMLDDDSSQDPQLATAARRLAMALGGRVLSAQHTPIAPELCIAIGTPRTDVAGASSLIQIGGARSTYVDGLLAGAALDELTGLVQQLESM
jgi:hypothetical protein